MTMKIAMIGQRGIPALFGGPERHVEELAVRLAARGHDVTVYTRPSYTDPGLLSYRGVHLKSLPSLATKHLDAITHSVICTLHAIYSGADIVHFHAAGPGLLCWLPRLVGRSVIVTLHGQDWRRQKWGGFASKVLRIGEWVSARLPHATICVSSTLKQEIDRVYGAAADFIPNGVSVVAESDTGILEKNHLKKGGYVLFAARLVPEKGCHHLLAAWAGNQSDMKLVIAGDSGFSDAYVDQLKAAAPRDVVFLGWVYGAQLATLFRNAALFVMPSDLEGMPIALLEALGYGVPVLASDIPEIIEVLGEWGATFRTNSVEDLREQLRLCLADLPRRKKLAAMASGRVAEQYDWDAITTSLLEIYKRVT
ncbi:glycosyltransferase [Methylolobus aquaticus]|nr:glycosyltransferase [Methylolobus aquaticus]